MPDYLERVYWGANADSRLGPSLDEDSSIWAKPHCMTRPYDEPSVSDPVSENASHDESPERRATAKPSSDMTDSGKALAIAGAIGLLTLGITWGVVKLTEKFQRR